MTQYKYIQCPDVFDRSAIPPEWPIVFLAGGITNCPIWQTELAELLSDTKIVVINPRRENFPSVEENPNIAREQIQWEFDHIKIATNDFLVTRSCAMSFWFTDATVQPITLFELGKASIIAKNLFVGVSPNYIRREDVEIQLELERPDTKIASTIKGLSEQIKEWAELNADYDKNN